MEDRYNVECCEFMHAHDEIVEKVQKEMPSEDTLYDLTELFRIFGDSTRIRILYVLFEAEMCVCDIAALLGMTQSAISHQLKALKNARLVKSRLGYTAHALSAVDDNARVLCFPHLGIDQGVTGDIRVITAVLPDGAAHTVRGTVDVLHRQRQLHALRCQQADGLLPAATQQHPRGGLGGRRGAGSGGVAQTELFPVPHHKFLHGYRLIW